MTAVKMFYLHIHTGFLDSGTTTFKFDRSVCTLSCIVCVGMSNLLCRKTLDGSPVKKQEKFPSPFHASLEVEWDKSEAGGVYREASWQNLPYPKASPLSCFSSVTEQEEVFKQFGEERREGWTR